MGGHWGMADVWRAHARRFRSRGGPDGVLLFPSIRMFEKVEEHVGKQFQAEGRNSKWRQSQLALPSFTVQTWDGTEVPDICLPMVAPGKACRKTKSDPVGSAASQQLSVVRPWTRWSCYKTGTQFWEAKRSVVWARQCLWVGHGWDRKWRLLNFIHYCWIICAKPEPSLTGLFSRCWILSYMSHY